jgi:acyl-CoA thioester hydrolase
MNGRNRDAPVFAHPVRVYWEDTDAGGIVFYANYLKFFERARTEWLRSLGLQQSQLREATGGIFVVSDTSVRYRLEQVGRATLSIAQQARMKRDGALLCEGTIRIGWVDVSSLRPARIPSTILEALAQ